MNTKEILNGLEKVGRESQRAREYSLVYTPDSVETVVSFLIAKIDVLEKENYELSQEKRKLNTPIAELIDPLTNEKVNLKVVNKLYFRANCNTLGDVVMMGRNKLKMIPSLGPTTMKELDRVMCAYGFKKY